MKKLTFSIIEKERGITNALKALLRGNVTENRNLVFLGINPTVSPEECRESPRSTKGRVSLKRKGRTPLSPSWQRGSSSSGEVKSGNKYYYVM